MMMHPMREKLDQHYREDMMRKAETIRQAHDLESANSPMRGSVLLNRVGKTLTTVGIWLQERTDGRDKSPVHQRHEDRSFGNLAQSH